jgi:hypothetical protein
MAHAINWFEIPVTDINRAAKFYGSIFSAKMEPTDMGGVTMAMFQAEPGEIGGALVKSESHIPSAEGALIYLNGGDDLSKVLNKVEAAGGKVTMPKTSIGEYGFIGFFTDTEGNKVGLHSMN